MLTEWSSFSTPPSNCTLQFCLLSVSSVCINKINKNKAQVYKPHPSDKYPLSSQFFNHVLFLTPSETSCQTHIFLILQFLTFPHPIKARAWGPNKGLDPDSTDVSLTFPQMICRAKNHRRKDVPCSLRIRTLLQT